MGATQRLARLLTVLHSGELLAAYTAAHQARLAPDAWMQRALNVQAAQERHHSAIAETALSITRARGAMPDVTAALRARITRDLATGELSRSFIGLQGVVEHMGEALLERLGAYQHPAGVLLHRLRLRVLAQERGHVALGARCREALASAGNSEREAFEEYCALGRTAAVEVTALLDDARLDANAYWTDVQARLTHWHALAQVS